MLDFGTTGSHGNAITFADRAILDAMTKYTLCFTLRPRAAPWTNATRIIGKLTGTDGWTLQAINNAGNNRIRMTHGSAGTTVSAGDNTTNLVNGTTYRVILWWDGSVFRYYINGVSEGDVAFTKVIAANAVGFFIGNQSGLTSGAQCALGQVMLYPNYNFTSGELAQWDAGQTVPNAAQLELWHKGIEIPGVDRVRGEAGVLNGTVVALSDPTDAYFPDSRTVPQWRRLATHRLMRRRTQEPIFTLNVPDHFLSIPVASLFNLSHDSAFLSASRLAGTPLGTLLASEPWRRSSMRLIGISDDPLNRTVQLRFKDHEAFGSTYWTTDRLPNGTDELYVGLGRLDVGGVHTVTRSSKALLEQANNVVDDIAVSGQDGELFRLLGAYQEKMSHLGFLAEDITDNVILQSHAKNGFTGWTFVDGLGGSHSLGSLVVYPNAVTPNSWRFTVGANPADTYMHQTFAVLSADGHRRIYIVKSEEDDDTIISWRLQRSSDNFWWNDATPGWQSGALWNRLTNSFDNALGAAGKPRAVRHISKPINIASNQNWTIAVGLEDAALPQNSHEINIYSVEALKGRLRFSSVQTEAAAVTTDADVVNVERTSLPQLVSATRYSASCRMVAIQDGADLVDGDKLCLWYLQYSNTDADDYDVLIYEKPAGASPRFSFERFINGVFSARATYTVTIVPGTEYKIVCIATASSGNDLGLSNSSLRILVNGVQGVDGLASGNHSSSEAHTELWKGCAPSAASLKRAMNYVWNLRFWTRCLTNEEAQAA